MVATVTTRYFERDGYYSKSDPEHRKASGWQGQVDPPWPRPPCLPG